MLIFSDRLIRITSTALLEVSHSGHMHIIHAVYNMEMERNLVKLYIGYTGLLTEWWICPLTRCKIHWWWYNVTQEYYSLSHNIPL